MTSWVWWLAIISFVALVGFLVGWRKAYNELKRHEEMFDRYQALREEQLEMEREAEMALQAVERSNVAFIDYEEAMRAAELVQELEGDTHEGSRSQPYTYRGSTR